MTHYNRRLAVAMVVLSIAFGAKGNDLEVAPEKLGKDVVDGTMVERHLMRQLNQAIQHWRDDYERRTSPEDIAAYQKRVRADFIHAIGGLPERTPLAAEVKGTVLRSGYRVEKILFQSQPKHHVTALLFIPDPNQFKPPFPGVLVPCGHAMTAKGSDDYQSMGALLALNGMVALVIDPIDQGERGQYLGKGGWPKLWGTAAHCNLGMGCVLLGQNTARFEIWDGMRGIDYLQSRAEVDPNRIGCTGNSGGGTQTSYLMALDDRIRAAAPSCYITSTSRLLQTHGVDDSEQQIFGQMAFGLHEADFLTARAPSPVLVCAATKDFFDIDGTWETFRYAKRLFTRLRFAERVDILENDAKHNYNTLQRQGVARWMSRWLLGKDQPITEPEIKLLGKEQYQCLPDGQVLAIPGERSAYDLNEEYENALAIRRDERWQQKDRASLLDEVRRLARIRKLSEIERPRVETVGSATRPEYTVQQLLIRPEEDIVLPALLFLPSQAKSDRVVLYVHQEGKAADAGPGGPIDKRVRAGQTVLAVDLRGTGQTQSVSRFWGGPEHQDSYRAYLLGRSLVGMRAEDVLVCARYAAQRLAGGRKGSVHLVAIGKVGIPSLHAAALEPELFCDVSISRMLVSWSHLLHSRLNTGQVINLVHGALTCYDLPNLEQVLGKTLSLQEPVNAMGEVLAKAR